MDDADGRLLEALDLLNAVADELRDDEALDELDRATLQTFWQEWPRTSAWAGALWRRLNAEIAEPVDMLGDPHLDETGGGD